MSPQLSVKTIVLSNLASIALSATALAANKLMPAKEINSQSSSLSSASKSSVIATVDKEKNENSVKSFRDWKNEKIQAITLQIQNMQNENKKLKADPNTKPAQLVTMKKQLDQLDWSLQVAQDLSVTDYCALYLSQQTLPKRFEIAASKLTTDEVAELMRAYADSLTYGSGNSSDTVINTNAALSKQTRAEREK